MIDWTEDDERIDRECIAERHAESLARRAAGRLKWHRS